MEKMVRDGWYLVYGYEVYVEGGEVKRAKSGGLTAYPYRRSRYGGWDLDTHMSIDALRSGLLRDTVIIRQGGGDMTYSELDIYKAVCSALEKQIAKKPLEDGYLDIPCVCPSCGADVATCYKYCSYCGQRLLWGSEKI